MITLYILIKMAGEWRCIPTVHRAKDYRLVRTRVLPVCDNAFIQTSLLKFNKKRKVPSIIPKMGNRLVRLIKIRKHFLAEMNQVLVIII